MSGVRVPLRPPLRACFGQIHAQTDTFVRRPVALQSSDWRAKVRKTHLRFTKTDASLSVSELETQARGWLLDSETRQHSRTTLGTRRIIVDKLLWFLRQQEYPG